MPKKIPRSILTLESESRMRIEFVAARTNFIKLISIVQKKRKVTNFSRRFIVDRGTKEANRKLRDARDMFSKIFPNFFRF